MENIKRLKESINIIMEVNQDYIINQTLKIKLSTYEKRIERIVEELEDFKTNSLTQIDSNLILEKFKKFHHSELESNDFKIKEIRWLTFNLNIKIYSEDSILTDAKMYLSFINLIKDKWLNSFLIGLYISAIKNWELNNSLKILEVVEKEIKGYNGNIKRYNRIKNNIKYFIGTTGIDTLVKRLNKERIDFDKVFDFLEIPESIYPSYYFSKLIIKYYENNINIDIALLDNFENYLDKHNNDLTKKTLIPKLIANHEKSSYDLFERIKELAFDQIGDPGNFSKWASIPNMSENEIKRLKTSQEILNRWLIHKFINVFFEICINDPERKKYWLQYVDKINTFKVYGTLETKRLLKLDDRIKDFINSRFIIIDGNTNKSAFLMEIKDYSLIEFGDSSNAFYAYKKNSKYRKAIDGTLDKLEELKFPSLPSLHSFPLEENGKLHHRGDWQRNFNDFLRRKVL